LFLTTGARYDYMNTLSKPGERGVKPEKSWNWSKRPIWHLVCDQFVV